MEDGSWRVCFNYFFSAGVYGRNLNAGKASISFFSLISHSETHLPVFNVTDCHGNRIRDEGSLSYIQKVSGIEILSFSFLLLICLVHQKNLLL